MFALAILLQAALQSPAPVLEVDPIDSRYEDCIGKDSTTVGMANCADDAYVAWDKAMNVAYAALLKHLSKAEQAQLRDSQRKWVEFRDSEFAFIDSAFSHADGTMWIPIRRNDRTDVVRGRALQLRARLVIFESESE